RSLDELRHRDPEAQGGDPRRIPPRVDALHRPPADRASGVGGDLRGGKLIVAKPVIFSVDDDAEVLAAVERDLRQHYRNDYRILKAGSGPEALEAARQLKQRDTPVALFLVDERMPGMSGTEF